MAAATSSEKAKATVTFSVDAAPELIGDTGVSIKTLQPGDGIHFPKKGQTVRMHYEARLKIDGHITDKFDSSRARGEPLVCRLGAGQLISGLELALPRTSKGATVIVEVPPLKAYGQRGYPPIVPPDAVVVYEIEILAIE